MGNNCAGIFPTLSLKCILYFCVRTYTVTYAPFFAFIEGGNAMLARGPITVLVVRVDLDTDAEV